MNAAVARERIALVSPVTASAEVLEISGPIIRAALFRAAVGDVVSIAVRGERAGRLAQVVGYSDGFTVLSAYDGTQDILPGARVTHCGPAPEIELSPVLLGTAVDGLGRRLSRFAEPAAEYLRIPAVRGRLERAAPSPFARRPIREALPTGIRAFDGFVTLGKGQRIAILAEPGVGKSSLIGAVARHTSADVNVIGLIGERGREAAEFLEESLSGPTRSRSVLVLSTSDESPLARASAAAAAQRIAEYFRAAGLHVLLQIDSLTRYIRALRELGLAAGEQPVRRGYPPSVFAELPKLIERAGAAESGSITALYTVLTSASPDEDPMIEELKGLTDGHLVLAKALADRSHYPAIDVVASLSRLQPKLLPAEALDAVKQIRSALALYEQEKDLLALGAAPDARLAAAADCSRTVMNYLAQGPGDHAPLEATLARLAEIRDRGSFSEIRIR